MSLSLRDLLHLMADKLQYASEAERDAFHDLVNEALAPPPVTDAIPPPPASPPVGAPGAAPTANDPYPPDGAP